MDIELLALPKIELHLHLEGALRPDTVRELALRNGSAAPDAGALWRLPPGGYPDLPAFVEASGHVLDACLRGPEDYERIACECIEDLARQNVRYAEISVAWNRARRLGIAFGDLLAALTSATRSLQQDWPIRIGWIVGLSRQRGGHAALEAVQAILAAGAGAVVGLDLHGDEASVPAAEFSAAYALAGRGGLGLRAHAGEGLGPDSVREAIGQLGVTRIAHGVRAIEDPLLLDHLRDRAVTLDVCPSSNVRLGIARSWREHPLRRLFEHGVRVTLSSDDPLFFDTTVTRELELARSEQGFTLGELKRIMLNAADAAFLPDNDRSALRAEIERNWSTGTTR